MDVIAANEDPHAHSSLEEFSDATGLSHVEVDASAGVEILNRTASGIQLARWLEAPHIEVWTVEHFHLEVAKVLRRYVLAGELDDIEAGRRVALLAQWELDVARVAPLLVDAWSMRHNVTLHDALYVALARQLDATLLTADRKLAAAPGLGVRTRTAHLKLT
jgi:predicted nucleic acid-binding protein